MNISWPFLIYFEISLWFCVSVCDYFFKHWPRPKTSKIQKETCSAMTLSSSVSSRCFTEIAEQWICAKGELGHSKKGWFSLEDCGIEQRKELSFKQFKHHHLMCCCAESFLDIAWGWSAVCTLRSTFRLQLAQNLKGAECCVDREDYHTRWGPSCHQWYRSPGDGKPLLFTCLQNKMKWRMWNDVR